MEGRVIQPTPRGWNLEEEECWPGFKGKQAFQLWLIHGCASPSSLKISY